MTEAPTRSGGLSIVSELLVARYGALGAQAAESLGHWLSGSVPLAYPEILERHLAPEHVGLLFDCFWQILPFGTGGRRGRVGYGPNRINPTTIATAVQGHCDYLHALYPDEKNLTVVIANDVRVFKDVTGTYAFLGDSHPLLAMSSRSFSQLAAEIYAGNGIVAYLPEPEAEVAYLSTPELSFSVGELGAHGGIVISASHNPPDDNGIKLYDRHGSQPVAPDDQRLLDAMSSAAAIQSIPFAEALRAGRIRAIPHELHARYVKAYVELYAGFMTPRPDLPVVYTPLCGVGSATVGDVLGALGFPIATPPREGPDGTFQVIPFRSPNPEVPQSTKPARDFADSIGSGIVLSSDPDADRAGLEVKLSDGSWYHFDGNQLASVILYALMLDPEGPRRSGLVVETLVTTKLLRRIAELRGESPVVDDLLVGFKYVANVMKSLGATGRYGNVDARPEALVLAAEESHGVCMLPKILDKDSTPACMLLAGLYQRERLKGRTLLDYYVAMLEHAGGYDSVNRSLMMSGPEGVAGRDRIMAWLRGSPPAELGGARVLRIVDHWDQQLFGPFLSESDRLPRNTLELFTERFVIIVRPSGTEPKVKFYCHLLPEGAPKGVRGQELLGALRSEAERVTRAVYRDLLVPLEITLSAAALALTDIIDVDKKRAFDRDVVPELERRIVGENAADARPILAWLAQVSTALVPGADPLPALKSPVALICAALSEKNQATPALLALADWARS